MCLYLCVLPASRLKADQITLLAQNGPDFQGRTEPHYSCDELQEMEEKAAAAFNDEDDEDEEAPDQ